MVQKDSTKGIEAMVAQMPRLLRTLGRVYMAGTKALLEDFGAEGEKMVRQWIRRFGTWRGQELRKGHMALGLPINMESIMRYWDNSSTFYLTEEWDETGSWSPCEVKVPVKQGECYIYEPWAEADFWLWGDVYCDEVHQHTVQAYHPDAVVVIPQRLGKRDSRCTFKWVMPPNAAKQVDPIKPYPGQDVLKDWQSGTREQAGICSLRRTIRITAAMVHFLWEVIREFRPKEAESEFGRIMDRMAADRGSALKKERERQGWGSGPEDLFLNFDMPYTFSWEVGKKGIPSGVEIEISYCPMAETWDWLGSLKVMKPYCEHCYSGIASKYDPSLRAGISRCKTGGDSTCLIRIAKTS
jgi:hypothetical protein